MWFEQTVLLVQQLAIFVHFQFVKGVHICCFNIITSETVECVVLFKTEYEKKFFVGSVFVIMTAVINRYLIDFASALVVTWKLRAQTLYTVIYVSSNFCSQLPALKTVCYFCQS